jgi:hypothetical protein
VTEVFAKNVGPLDRAIRLSVGIVFLPAGLLVLGGLDGNASGIVAAAVGAIGLVTGATGRCPTYALLGIDTLPRKRTATEAEAVTP